MEPQINENHKVGTLYVVSTPIGNKKDITYRAAEVLQNADIVIGEEIKEASRVLMHLSLTKDIELLNEHNEAEKTYELFELLKQGKTLALISDCGTPIFADPGLNLVKLCIQNDIRVTAIPGANSIMTALVTSGFTLKQFLFAGFLQRTGDDREDEILQLAKVRKTVVIMDTPYRLKVVLQAFADIIPNRKAYIGMNLTMPSETHHYGTFIELYEKFMKERIKAEYVLVFEGLDNTDKAEKARLSKLISLKKLYGTKASKRTDRDEEENIWEEEESEVSESYSDQNESEIEEEAPIRERREKVRSDFGRNERHFDDRKRDGKHTSDRPRRRSEDFSDRPPRKRSFEGENFDERPRRSSGEFSDRKPRIKKFGDRDFNSRPKRSSEGFSDRPPRKRFDEGQGSDRPRRSSEGFSDRPPRKRFDEGQGSDRPRRSSEGFSDRPPRKRFEGGRDSDRPRRRSEGFSDRPPRKRFDDNQSSDRPKRRTEGFSDRPRGERKFGDRPPKREGFGSDRKRFGSSSKPTGGKHRKDGKRNPDKGKRRK